jgi:hypothetical protein
MLTRQARLQSEELDTHLHDIANLYAQLGDVRPTRLVDAGSPTPAVGLEYCLVAFVNLSSRSHFLLI